MPRPKKQQTPQGLGPLDSYVEREVVPKKPRAPDRKKPLSSSTAAVRRRFRRLLLHRLHQDLGAFMMGRGILPDSRWTGSW